MNHSCAPTAALSIRRSTRGVVLLEARVFKKKMGTAAAEVTCSYISARALLADRSHRAEALKLAFDFDCECPRCSSLPSGSLRDDHGRVEETVAGARAALRASRCSSGVALDVAAAEVRVIAQLAIVLFESPTFQC
jgi:hypothetical protein